MSMKVTPARPTWTSLTAAWTVTVCPTCALISAGAIVCARAGSAATIKPRAKMSVRIAVSPCLNTTDRLEHNMNIHPRQLRPVGADLITRPTARAHLVPRGGLRARAEADQHRCRHLRLHRQHLVLRYRHAAEAIRQGARQS